MRLLSRRYVGDFGSRSGRGRALVRFEDGDFEGLVRKIWREEHDVEIPGTMDEEEEEVEEEEEEKEAAVEEKKAVEEIVIIESKSGGEDEDMENMNTSSFPDVISESVEIKDKIGEESGQLSKKVTNEDDAKTKSSNGQGV